jgi:hypothetical protein
MAERLHELLEREEPTALHQIERALEAQPDLTPDQEAVLNALIWRRCTAGGAGFLGTVLRQDCAILIEGLPGQLARIGATDAAVAVKELHDAIPLEDEQIKRGVADWMETQQDVIRRARELEEDLDDIALVIWDFMKSPHSEIPDVEVSTRAEYIVSSMMKFFRPNPQERS